MRLLCDMRSLAAAALWSTVAKRGNKEINSTGSVALRCESGRGQGAVGPRVSGRAEGAMGKDGWPRVSSGGGLDGDVEAECLDLA